MPEQFLTTKQAAEALDLDPRTIRFWIRSGRIKATRNDPTNPKSRYKIPKADIDAILEEQKRQLGRET